jgi:hypothetical protein
MSCEPTRLGTPVLLIVFNRPSTTRQVMESIRSVRPSSLFVVGDGPRSSVAEDRMRCTQVRSIATAVDWPCDLVTCFRDVNLGAGTGVAEAISWFFENVEAGIVLEDDCVPSRSFYRFCEELLRHYESVTKVMHISGNNFQYGRKRGNGSYYFSQYTHTWGWATWRRAWRYYDFSLIPLEHRSHVWDAQWHQSVKAQGGLAALPNVNLVTNIGFGADATHTTRRARFAGLPAEEMRFPLRHPADIRVDSAADRLTYFANFKQVPHLHLLPLYVLADWITLVPGRLRKAGRLLGSAAGRLTRRLGMKVL